MSRSLILSLCAVLAGTACDTKKADGDEKAGGDEKADAAKSGEAGERAEDASAAKAADSAKPDDAKPADADAGAELAVADYPKGIVGKWKKVKGLVLMEGVDPLDTMAPGLEMILTYEADGRATNSGSVQGKKYETAGTYKVVGNVLTSGGEEKGLTIAKMTANELTLELTTGEATTRDIYERVP